MNGLYNMRHNKVCMCTYLKIAFVYMCMCVLVCIVVRGGAYTNSIPSLGSFCCVVDYTVTIIIAIS